MSSKGPIGRAGPCTAVSSCVGTKATAPCSPFVPIGVAQGWSPDSYRHSVERLQQIGYDHIAIGGLVPLKTPEILEVLAAVHPALRPGVRVHLFGVTRVAHVATFARYG